MAYISELPTPPSRQRPSDFASEGDTFLAALPTFQSEANALRDEVNGFQSSASASATAANASQVLAEQAAQSSLSSANASLYVATTTYNNGDRVIGSDGATYSCLTDSTLGDDPVSSTSGDWVQVTFSQPTTSIETTAFSALPFLFYFVDTTAAPIVVTLSATPAVGTIITFSDYAGTWKTNNVTLLRNGNKIQGLEENMSLNLGGVTIGIVYTGSTYGWRIM
jgi:hypothetical protein